MRIGLRRVFGTLDEPLSFVREKLVDLRRAAALGATVVASLVVSNLATNATRYSLALVGLADSQVATVLLKVLAVALALALDTVLFAILLSRLSGAHLPWRRVRSGALLGAVGFEVLKLFGTFLIARTTQNPIYATFGVVVGLLVWINFVSRLLVYVAAWTATDRSARQPAGRLRLGAGGRWHAAGRRGRRAGPSPCAGRWSARRWGPGWPASSPGAALATEAPGRASWRHRRRLRRRSSTRARSSASTGPAGPARRATRAGRHRRSWRPTAAVRAGRCGRPRCRRTPPARRLLAGGVEGADRLGQRAGWEAPAQQRGRVAPGVAGRCAAPWPPGCGRRGWRRPTKVPRALVVQPVFTPMAPR